MRNDFRAVTRARTIEEKKRRHIHGDKGAKFSQAKYMVLTGQIMGAVTTFTTKDCLVAVICESDIRKHPKNKMNLVDVYSAAKRSREYANGQALEIGDRDSNAITSNIEHHLSALIYEK